MKKNQSERNQYCMICGRQYISKQKNPYCQIRCPDCIKNCVFCGNPLAGKYRESGHFGCCNICRVKRLNYLIDKHSLERDFFQFRSDRKKKLGADQKRIADKIRNHFNIEECYKLGRFLIDIYFKDLDIYTIFKSTNFIKVKENQKFGHSEEYFVSRMKKFIEAFLIETGKSLSFISTTDLLKMEEEELVDFFRNLSKSDIKIEGELFV